MPAPCRELPRARWWSPGMKTCPVLGAWQGDSCVLTSRRQAGGGAEGRSSQFRTGGPWLRPP